jgi:hypothetical protein
LLPAPDFCLLWDDRIRLLKGFKDRLFMVFDSGKRPAHDQNNDWQRQSPKAKPQQIAQAIPIPRGLPFPVPKIPWMTGEDVKKIYNMLKMGRNPLTGETISSEAEKKAFKNLTAEQIKGLQNSKYKEELKYADDSFRNDRSCAVMQLGISNGGQPKSMMVKALTGANDPTLIVDPNGHTALFDGMYRGAKYRTKIEGIVESHPD